jgi:hypothetical protein
MKASSIRSAVTRLVFSVLIALTFGMSVPTAAVAKTRPPIEAGDPEIGNEKPRPSGAPASSNLKSDLSSNAHERIDFWRRFVLMVRCQLAYRLL